MALRETADRPLVSVILTASAGRGDPSGALRSVLAQDFPELEIIVISDGRADLGDLPAVSRPPVRLIPWPSRLARAAALNEAIRHARGRYVCYLSDRDVYYPHHVRTLAEALEADDHCRAAYSDVYTTIFRPTADGRREVLGKVLLGARDFDRSYLLGHDHIPPPGLMHHRDLLTKTGPFNERLGALADWDMHRKLAFFTDFLHVCGITAETCIPQAPGGEAYSARPETEDRRKGVCEVLSARPPKPWPRMPDLSIVFAPEGASARA
ncbi:MAG: glycosyltransferase, partial [Phycisphaerae bacterium]